MAKAPRKTISYDVNLLKQIAAATAAGGFLYADETAALSALLAGSYIETNMAMRNTNAATGASQVACKATPGGMRAAGYDVAAAAVEPVQIAVAVPEALPPAPSMPAPQDFNDAVVRNSTEYTIEEYDELPDSVGERGHHLRPREEVYPFKLTMPGQRFFIPQQVSLRTGAVVRHFSAAQTASHRIREMHEEYTAQGIALPEWLVPKQYKCITVRAGQVLNKDSARPTVVHADGEYIYCISGFIAPPKKREVA